MLRTDDILATIRMIQEQHLDVRTVTMGVNLQDCASPHVVELCNKIHEKILDKAKNLRSVCDGIANKYGIQITNRRIAVTPISRVAEGHSVEEFLEIARTLDRAAGEIDVDILGGYAAHVQKGMTPGEQCLIESLPEALSTTERVCAAVNVATSAAGINVDAIMLLSQQLKDAAARSADHDGFACAKLVIFANAPEDNPFMAGAFLGCGEPECVINIGVSGPGVVREVLESRRASGDKLTLGQLAEEIKSTSFSVTRCGELIGREVAHELDVAFGIVDLSLAPTPTVGDSVGEILQAMGIAAIGAPGSTAAVALLNDAVKKGGMFASSSVGGLSGAFVPVSEDHALSEAVRDGHLSLEKLEAMTSVCSVGLDMVAVPGDTDSDTLAAVILDEMAIGVINHKTTAVRIIPVPGKQAGDKAAFGGLFGEAYILPVPNAGQSSAFVRHGGRIPAPLHSLRN